MNNEFIGNQPVILICGAMDCGLRTLTSFMITVISRRFGRDCIREGTLLAWNFLETARPRVSLITHSSSSSLNWTKLGWSGYCSSVNSREACHNDWDFRRDGSRWVGEHSETAADEWVTRVSIKWTTAAMSTDSPWSWPSPRRRGERRPRRRVLLACAWSPYCRRHCSSQSSFLKRSRGNWSWSSSEIRESLN